VADFPHFILASSSPRRRDLLSARGLDFIVEPASVEELTVGPARELPLINARLKGEEVLQRFPDHIVLAADTVVIHHGKVYGKPANLEQAHEMLRSLTGQVHEVISGVHLAANDPRRECSFIDITRIRFHRLDESQIAHYLERINPLDKAGAYAAQEDNGELIAEVEGSLENVVGLPVDRVIEALLKIAP